MDIYLSNHVKTNVILWLGTGTTLVNTGAIYLPVLTDLRGD